MKVNYEEWYLQILRNYIAMSFLSRSIQWLIFAAVAAAVLAVGIVTSQNLTVISLKFLSYEFPPIKLGLALLGMATAGFLLGELLPLGKRF
jgi:uncharacterized integral membrane protein